MIYLVIALTISQGFGTWALLRFLAAKDDKFIHQVERLCNRIQAPEKAVTQSLIEDAPPLDAPPYVEFDNDHDFWASKTPTRN